MKGKDRKDDVVARASLGEEGKGFSRGGVVPIVIIIIAALIIIVGYFVSSNRSDQKTEIILEEKQQSFEEVHGSLSADQEGNVSKGGSDEIEEHFNAGVRFSLRRDYDRAIAEYKKAIELDPLAAGIHSNLGFAYLDNEDLEMSIAEQKKALELDSSLANAYYGLALALEKKGDGEGAIKNWEKYIEIAPSGTIWWNKAKAKLEEIKKINE